MLLDLGSYPGRDSLVRKYRCGDIVEILTQKLDTVHGSGVLVFSYKRGPRLHVLSDTTITTSKYQPGLKVTTLHS